MQATFILLLLYQVKNVACNCVFPTGNTLKRLNPKLAIWIVFLFRGLAHGIGTFLIVKFFWETGWPCAMRLCGIDFLIHLLFNVFGYLPDLLAGNEVVLRKTAFLGKYRIKIADSLLSWFKEQLDEVTAHAAHYYIIWTLVH